jgi:hypothetical protein
LHDRFVPLTVIATGRFTLVDGTVLNTA